jgi:hypothetical protein
MFILSLRILTHLQPPEQSYLAISIYSVIFVRASYEKLVQDSTGPRTKNITRH